MNPAYSVILFTTASGAGYGLLALSGLVGFNHGRASSSGFALTSLLVALALITLGLLSSTLHLGHPARAWRAFSQWRSSWLSREGIAAVATYPVALLYGATWSGLVDAPHLIAPLGLCTAIMSAITVFCTGKIYSTLKTIRAWNHVLTIPVYLTYALATGATLLLAVAFIFNRVQVFQWVFALFAISILAILKIVYWVQIDAARRTHTMAAATGLGTKAGESVRQWEVPHTNTNFIMKEMGFAVARKHAQKLRNLTIALLVATAVLIYFARFVPWLVFPAVPVVLASAWVERWLFFAEAEHVVNLFYGKQAA
jgi:sulfite dehydrogenase (quinone) subunit SoeC